MKLSLLLAAFTLTPICAIPAAHAADADMKPFRAVYTTLRNDEEVGRTVLSLVDNHDGTWTLKSQTKGTAGLAKLAGLDVVETSTFRWKNGRPEALRYDYRQDATFRQRTRHADFDWKAGKVRVSEGGKNYRYATVPGLIDRQSVTLAIASDLARGAKSLDYQVAVKDRVEDMRYLRGKSETLQVPAGAIEAVVVRRQGEPGADRRRVARSWFAASLGWLPVQIEQTGKDDNTVTLKLVSVDR